MTCSHQSAKISAIVDLKIEIQINRSQIDLPPTARALDEKNIPYRLFTHPGPVHSLEQAARERNHRLDQVVRSILFRVTQDEYMMVPIAGERQVAWRVLRKHLGQSRITMASEEQVRRVTGAARQSS